MFQKYVWGLQDFLVEFFRHEGVRACCFLSWPRGQQLHHKSALCSSLKTLGSELTNSAAERALHQLVIQSKISQDVKSTNCAIFRSRLLTATTK